MDKPSDTNMKQSPLFPMFYGLLIIYFALNFVGTSLLKYLFLILLFWGIITLLKEKSLTKCLIVPFSILAIVGQGKLLWSYHPVIHVSMDYVVIFLILKIFMREKRLFNLSKYPPYIYAPALFHFLWYIVQLFNLKNVGFFGALAAGKIYILPIVLFFSLLLVPFEKNEGDNLQLQKVILALCLAQSSISIFQFFMGEEFLRNFHPYYIKTMGEAFTGMFFRPFGTTALPGGASIILFVFLGVTLLYIHRTAWHLTIIFLTIGLSSFTLINSQVRSAYLKYFSIIVLISIAITLTKKFRPFTLLKRFSPPILITGILAIYFFPQISSLDTPSFNTSLSRLESITNTKTLKGSRSGTEAVFTSIKEKISEEPMGLGPGRTGAASRISSDIIKNDPIYGRKATWTMDNLLLSLAIELGVGMVFYVSLLIVIIMILFSKSLQAYFRRPMQEFRLIIIPLICCLVILAGNWGAVGLPYNPESFCFWFYAAFGLRIAFSDTTPSQPT